MNKRFCVLIALSSLLMAGAAMAQQYPIMEKVADKVIQKYKTSTCEQLWQERQHSKGQPKPEAVQRAVTALNADPKMRQAFFNKVSAPIAKKMFECGMIP